MNVTASSKVDVGDVPVSEESSTAAKQLKPKEKQTEDVTGKFRYDRFGHLCMVYFYVTVLKLFVIFKCVIKFDKVFVNKNVFM